MIRKIFEKAVHKRMSRPLKIITILISAVFALQVFQGYYLFKALNNQNEIINLTPQINLPQERVLGASTKKKEIEKAVPDEDPVPFKDIPESHPSYKAINFLKSKGIVNSGSENLFNPDHQISRAEAVSMVLRAAEIKTQDDAPNIFIDIYEDDWYAKEVTTAQFLGLIGGYEDYTFRPQATMTQAEFIKFAVMAFDLSVDKYNSKFQQWYDPYLDMAIDKGGITEKNPDIPLSRAMAAEIIFQILNFK